MRATRCWTQVKLVYDYAIASCWAHGLETTDTWQQKGRRGGKLLLFVSSAPGTIHYSVSDPHAACVSSCLDNSFFPKVCCWEYEHHAWLHDHAPNSNGIGCFWRKLCKTFDADSSITAFFIFEVFLGESAVSKRWLQFSDSDMTMSSKSRIPSLGVQVYSGDLLGLSAPWPELEDSRTINFWIIGWRITSEVQELWATQFWRLVYLSHSHLFLNQILTCGLTQDSSDFKTRCTIIVFIMWNIATLASGQRCF